MQKSLKWRAGRGGKKGEEEGGEEREEKGKGERGLGIYGVFLLDNRS